MATGLAVRISRRILLLVSVAALAEAAVAATVSHEAKNKVRIASCEGRGGAIALFESTPAGARGTSVRCADGTVDVLEGTESDAKAEAGKRGL
jgi:hypothetical protein